MNNFYPRSIFEVIDQSAIPEVVKTPLDKPMYLMAFASPKGDETMAKIKGDEFYKKYGTDIDFAKYGQALLQADAVIKAGGTILAKRVVAKDATLANLAILGRVKSEEVQKVNEHGQPLYKDPQGNETTTAESNTPIMENHVTVKYEIQTTSNAKTMAEIRAAIAQLGKTSGKGNEFVYPLYILTDVGRGVSLKRVSMHPNYADSKYLDYMKYQLIITENNERLETIDFTFNPDVIEKGNNLSLQSMVNRFSKQVRCHSFESEIKEMAEKIAELTKLSVQEVAGSDILFGKEKSSPSTNISWIKIDEEGANLSHVYGIDLDKGTNGAFGDYPIESDAYKQQLVDFFSGKITTDIYDLDNYKIDLIVDANYPAEVKREIEKLVTFREDAEYIRDLGTLVGSLEEILEANKPGLKNRFCATYCLAYDIIEPYHKKQVPVTVGYTLARLLVDHFDKGRTRPLAGQLYNMIITEAVEGTVNFVPKVTPLCDEKQMLRDANINYASYFDGVLTIETLYTSQEKNTQLSFLNNVFGIQEVIKAVRTKCPKNRYSFIDGKDLDKYKQDVQEVLDSYSANYKSLKMEYIEDTTMVANKVFYAAIKVQFKDFVQTEWFKIYAIN